ncbi:MAG TPA: dihydrolipoyl dehydrogenase [Bacillota bacterium]|nr:dihydrolipoyl dehydrogenase [Bacillota bacterium]
MSNEYDLVILGGGPGGYVAAIRASQLDLKVAIVEKEKLGGTCLHKGCIPSKALLRSAEVYRQTKEANSYGIDVNELTLNFSKVQNRKEDIINRLHQGVRGLMKKGKIDVYNGIGRILGPSIFSPIPGTISIEHENGEENTMLIPKNVLIATGSKPRTLDFDIDGTYVLTSDEALKMEELPNSIIIVGGGVIGIEWASMLVDFGVNVTVLEYADQILPTEDKDIAKEVESQLKQRGVTVKTGIKVLSETLSKDEQVKISGEIKDKEQTFQADKILLSVGREANIDNIGLQNTSIEVKDNYIITNEYYQTKESHIYAIGDVVGSAQLAHVASHEGIVAVEHIAGKDPLTLKDDEIPSCIYSHPEVASIGFTEEEAKEQGFDVKVGKFSFQGNGKALVYGESNGFVKIIANKKNDDLLGIHMVGPQVTELISEATLAKFVDAIPWEISNTIHPHPSLSEAIGEAALAVDGFQLHG